MDVPVEYMQAFAEHLVVDAAETAWPTGLLNSLAEQRQVEEEGLAAFPVEVGQMVDGWIVDQQQRVTRGDVACRR
jgi:hypothetical protein